MKPHYLINGTIYREKNYSAKYVFFFNFLHKFCLKNFSFCEEFRKMFSKLCSSLHCKVPVTLVRY